MNTCLHCEKTLGSSENVSVCEDCQQKMIKETTCNTCHQVVETLKACGAVNYFCHTCNELKSKSAVQAVWKISQTV